ncbi:hypothetical protein TNCV_1439471 [Trichonephila clavipes]|nr:hypothetical protein TNCV_1439471 [Trichonephila clavipes]
MLLCLKSRPTGIVISDADCCAVESRFGSWKRKDMDICKCIVLLRHGVTINSSLAASPLTWLLDGKERWEALEPPPGCSPSKLGWNQAKSYCHLYGSQGHDHRQA